MCQCTFQPASIAQRMGNHRANPPAFSVLVCKAWTDRLAEDLVLAATSLVFQDHIRKPRMPHRSGSLSTHMPLRTRTDFSDLYNESVGLPVVDHQTNLILALCWTLANCIVFYPIYFLLFNLSSLHLPSHNISGCIRQRFSAFASSPPQS